MNNMLSASVLDSWARENPRKAQELLPELVLRLILRTSSQIADYDFPIEKGIQYSGYDGVLVSDEKTSYFPKGKSVWECGTNDDSLSKFESDIQKRTNNPLGVNVTEATFIFVTLKIWNHKKSIEELRNESRKKYPWKDIRIIDGCKIAIWLQEFTAVAAWFAEAIGRPFDGVRDIENYWRDYCESTDPKLNTEFFLIGRDKQIEALNEWMGQKSGTLIVTAESSLEAKLFLAAYFLSKSIKKNSGRVIIVEKVECWNQFIRKEEKNTILIPAFNFTEDIQCPTDIKALIPVSKYFPLSKISKNVTSVKIERRIRTLHNKALESIGIDNLDYGKIETSTRRSFMPFYRAITRVPSRKQPSWLSNGNPEDLIPAFLAGSWDEKKEGDRKAIELLSGLTYENYIIKIQKWLTMEDAPIFKVLSTYQMVSITDLWTFLYDSLSPLQVERFKKCVLLVLSAEDPTFELPEERWFMAPILGKGAKYSSVLKESLAIDLILLSEQKDRENICNIDSAEYYVDHIVTEILASIKTWQQWNSIAELLPSLAEASPNSYLKKIEAEIEDPESQFWQLFRPAKDLFTGRSYYTNVLWALEKLVWFDDYVIRAIELLAKINEKQFQYKLANTPINSLYSIFCVWYPQSCLSCDQRIKLIQRISKDYPETGKELIAKLIPSKGETCTNIEEPRWRHFEGKTNEGTTNKEYRDTVKAIATIAISTADTNADWQAIINKADVFFDLGVSWLEKMIAYSEKISVLDKIEIADLLRTEISSNRKFCNAEWAMPEDRISEMESALNQILPESIERYSYLFKQSVSLIKPIPYKRGQYDYESRSKQLHDLRVNTIQAMLERYGKELLIDFAMKAEATEELATIIVQNIMKENYDFSLLIKMRDQNPRLCTDSLNRLYSFNGSEGLFSALKDSQLSDEEIGSILIQSPLTFNEWERIQEFGEKTAEYYWQHVDAAFAFYKEYAHQDYLVDQLLKHNRPFSAVKAISYTEYCNTDMIIAVLEKCCERHSFTEDSGNSIKTLDPYGIRYLFDKLYSNQNIDLDKLIPLEMAFFTFFDFQYMPKGIARCFEKNPIDYVHFIEWAYKKDKNYTAEEGEETKGVSPEQAQMAYEILHRYKEIPGCNKSNVSREKFKQWVSTGYDYAQQIGLTRPFESCLGNLLSYAPDGEDGIYPHEVVREYFESGVSQTVINGFMIGRYNQRGGYAVTAGVGEKAIAENYRKNAAILRMDYPHTAAILDELAKSYSRESIYEYKRDFLDG